MRFQDRNLTKADEAAQDIARRLDEANTIFDELMGDNVQPRRIFIEQNALAASVDV